MDINETEDKTVFDINKYILSFIVIISVGIFIWILLNIKYDNKIVFNNKMLDNNKIIEDVMKTDIKNITYSDE